VHLDRRWWQRVLTICVLLGLSSCSGGGNSTITGADICSCVPRQPASADYRHAAKHVPLPTGAPSEVTVGDILAFPQGAEPARDAPRSGRELKLFHVAHAFVQLAWVNPGDCDVHIEISDSPIKVAARVIVETPVDSEYCSARRAIVTKLAAHGFSLGTDLPGGELPAAIPADVTGLAFQDFSHKRGSAFVKTVWELHPAIVNLR
jgi:hypothetical protein